MGWKFDGVNDYVTIANNAALDLPDGDWSLGGWARITSNAGDWYQYFISRNFTAGINAFYALLFENPGPAAPNIISSFFRDSDSAAAIVQSSNTPGTSTVWQHWLWTRSVVVSDVTITLYVDGVSRGSVINNGLDAINPSADLFLGWRNDLAADRAFNGDLAEWFKINRAVNSTERSNLATGQSPGGLANINDASSWYLKMLTGGAGGDYTEYSNGLTVTNNGSTNAGSHPVAYTTDGVSRMRVLPTHGDRAGIPMGV